MATETTEAPQQNMTADHWFDGGGQMEELQRISGMKAGPKRQEALQQFNEKNSAFQKTKLAPGDHAPVPETAKTHPAIEEAINKAMEREPEWMREIRGKTDDELRYRYLERQHDKAIRQGRVPQWTSLSEFLQSKPDLVDVAQKYDRQHLERKEVLSRMIERQGFNVSKAKVAYEERLNPTLVATARVNLGNRHISPGKYNDVLFSEVSKVKKVLTSAQSAGFKV